jgi:hypothetical protein
VIPGVRAAALRVRLRARGGHLIRVAGDGSARPAASITAVAAVVGERDRHGRQRKREDDCH